MHSRFRLASAIVALMAAIVVTSPVAASSPWTVFGQTGTNAYAYNVDCADNTDGTVTCHGQSIDVFEGKLHEQGTRNRTTEQTCYSEYTETFDPNVGEIIDSHALFGCTFGAGTLSIDQRDSITLAPTTIELSVSDCDASGCTESADGSTIVAGTWTGDGSTYSQKSKSKFDDGSCLQVYADRSSFRVASFQGSIASVEAQIHVGTFTVRTDCSF